MTKLVLIGTVEIAQGRKTQVLAALTAHKARCLNDEPGTLQMEVLAPLDSDMRFLFYEVYRDEAAFDMHRRGPSFARWREETAGMIVNVSATRCVLVEA